MNYSITKLSYEQSTRLLGEFDDFFHPPLSSHIDIDSYALKLSSHASFVIAKDNETIVGYIAFYCNSQAKLLYITSFCVAPQYRGRGISKSLLLQLEQTFCDSCEKIDLEVRKNNIPAIRFYTKNGFKTIEEKENTLILRIQIN